MPKYNCGAGRPIDMLVDECSEVIHECMKINRFYNEDGTHKIKDFEGTPARERLVQELGDLHLAIALFLKTSPLKITMEEIQNAVIRKVNKLTEDFGDDWANDSR